MTKRGTRLTVNKNDRKSCNFGKEERFSHITELVRRTAPKVGPGSYNNHVSHEKVKSQAVMRRTYANADDDYDYTIINDAVVKFRPRRDDNLRFSTIQYSSESTRDQINHSYALDRSTSFSNRHEESPYNSNKRPKSAAKRRESSSSRSNRARGSNLRNSGTLNFSFGVVPEDPLNQTTYFEKKARPKTASNAERQRLNKSMEIRSTQNDAQRKLTTKNTTKKTTTATSANMDKSYDHGLSKQHSSSNKTNSSLNLDDLDTSMHKEYSIEDFLPQKKKHPVSASSGKRAAPAVLKAQHNSNKPRLNEFSLRPEVKREIREMAARYFGLDPKSQKIRYY